LRAYGAENADYNSAELVLGELLGNAARHARGPIEIHVSWAGAFPILSMLDRGPAYDPGLAVPLDVYSEGGRGLFLVGLLARAFTVTRLFGGVNETRVELDVPARNSGVLV
jgi:anti-sigma regulatory factor (Ser/Thr protein kinase)